MSWSSVWDTVTDGVEDFFTGESAFDVYDAAAIGATALFGPLGAVAVYGAEAGLDLLNDATDGDGSVEWSDHAANLLQVGASAVPGLGVSASLVGAVADSALGDVVDETLDTVVFSAEELGLVQLATSAQAFRELSFLSTTALLRRAEAGDRDAFVELVSRAADELGVTPQQLGAYIMGG